MTADCGYHLVEDQRWISAVDDQGHEICGSYLSEGRDYWSLYVCEIVTEITGLRTPPHHEHFWGRNGRIDSERWVELMACLIVMAQRLRYLIDRYGE